MNTQTALMMTVVSGTLAAAACTPECTLEAEMEDAAADNAVNCGTVRLNGDRQAADACVVEAFNTGKPFIAEYQTRGMDSETYSGLVGATDGTITLFHYDSDPSGGGGIGAKVTKLTCTTPTIKADLEQRDEGTTPIDCVSVASQGHVCG